MSNEQRAHDLTMLYIKFMNDMNLKNIANNSSDTAEYEVDFYNDYRRIYPEVLEKFNRDFPTT